MAETYDDETPFEKDVYRKLKERGLDVHSNVGIGGYCIDFAIKDGDSYALGIECDFNLYENSDSAENLNSRERDYHRQKYLESRGWKIYRLWSSEWWKNPDEQIDNIVRMMS